MFKRYLITSILLLLAWTLIACAPTPSPQPAVATTPPRGQPTAVTRSTPVPPTATPTPLPQVALDADALGNLAYDSEWTASKKAPLVDGEYVEAIVPGAASKIVIRLLDPMAFGTTADGRPFAAALLATTGGGSGTFIDLVAVVDEQGQLIHAATASLGDRVQVESLAIENAEIVVEMIQHGPDDPMCCPTQRVVQRYALRGRQLAQLSSQVEAASDIVGIVWEWERFEGADGTVIEVDDPSRYTLLLDPGGTYQVRADCNRSSGAYTVDGERLELQPGPTTLAECEPGSLYDAFLRYLGDVRAYVRAAGGDELVLNLSAGKGSLSFAR